MVLYIGGSIIGGSFGCEVIGISCPEVRDVKHPTKGGKALHNKVESNPKFLQYSHWKHCPNMAAMVLPHLESQLMRHLPAVQVQLC